MDFDVDWWAAIPLVLVGIAMGFALDQPSVRKVNNRDAQHMK